MGKREQRVIDAAMRLHVMNMKHGQDWTLRGFRRATNALNAIYAACEALAKPRNATRRKHG